MGGRGPRRLHAFSKLRRIFVGVEYPADARDQIEAIVPSPDLEAVPCLLERGGVSVRLALTQCVVKTWWLESCTASSQRMTSPGASSRKAESVARKQWVRASCYARNNLSAATRRSLLGTIEAMLESVCGIFWVQILGRHSSQSSPNHPSPEGRLGGVAYL